MNRRVLRRSNCPGSSLPAERRAQIADEVLARYIGGEQIAQIAGEYGYGHVSLYALLWKERESDWCDAQASRALARHADALSDLDAVKQALQEAKGDDALVEISRQRELLKVAEARIKSAQWELEKLMRRIYGQEIPQLHLSFNVGEVSTRIEALERELGVAATRLIETTSTVEEAEEATGSGD